MKINDAIFGAVFLVLSALVLWDVRSYPTIPGQDVGPAAFPGAVAALLAVCSVLLIVQGVRARDGGWFERGAWMMSPRQIVAFVVTLAGMLLYVIAADTIGFLILGTVILFALMLALNVRVPVALAVAVLATVAIHIVFYKALRVPLPWGLLPVLY